MKKDFLAVTDLEKKEILDIFSLASRLKKNPFLRGSALKSKNIVMLFSKPSTRTRLSFEIGINQLGGNAVYVDAVATQLGRGETIADTARVIGRYADGLVARLFAHSSIEEIARNFSGPVVNGLTDLHHPCQALGDLFTVQEHFGRLGGKTIAFVGNGNNNVAHSLMECSALLGVNMTVGCPASLEPQKDIVEESMRLAEKNNSSIQIVHNPTKAVAGADVIYTDVWVSMGEEKRLGLKERIKLLQPFQLNSSLLDAAKQGARVMHCLPAHRGEEITSEVIDSKNSIVFDQAENRLHTQKALLAKIFE